MTVPSRDEIIELVAKEMYSGPIINNVHRGHLVEIMVLTALGAEWRLVGLGWHPWDLQRGEKDERTRIQVKHSAALQLWGKTKSRSLSFGWSSKPPSDFFEYNPGEEIENEGWFCDLFVFGLHNEVDPDVADQADPSQWEFLVIPVCDLKHGQNTMQLNKALEKWTPVTWSSLDAEVEDALTRLRQNPI